MKVSVNWLKQFTEISISVDELVAKIGAQLGAVEDVQDLGKQYQGIIIARVVTCEKHPNADNLNICMIDDGGRASDVERNEAGLVQVVCGAPNVHADMMVAWLPPGATVPSTYDNDPFVLGKRELRGVLSNGMLASASELAIGDDHSGLAVIELDVAPGTDFAEAYELNDYIIDIENKMFTHRPDCFGILGVAREIAGIQQQQFSSPDWYRQALDRIQPGKERLEIAVHNDMPLVPRFMAVALKDVHVGPSPLMIQTYLSRVGLRPINNIVDATNYIMVLTGQPTHAYDYDKLPTKSLETRMSRPGDTLQLLNGKTVSFDDDTTVLITSGDTPIAIGGVMGGSDTEVSATTSSVVIECANFDMYNIRRTSMKYGLFTDAVTRFNKGQSVLQNDVVLEELLATLQYVAGGEVASDVHDRHGELAARDTVEVSLPFITERLGQALGLDEVADILRNVECRVDIADNQVLVVTPPYWRTDIEMPEDIVEEVGRLYGFDALPVVLPHRSIKPVQRNTMYDFKATLRDILSRLGANEVLTYSFVNGKLLEAVGQSTDSAFRLSNALSPELQYYRLSLTPSLLEKVHPNSKAGHDRFALFELNKYHQKPEMTDEQVPREWHSLGFVIAGDVAEKHGGAAYYQARMYLDTLVQQLGITLRYDVCPEHSDDHVDAPFDLSRSAYVIDAATNTKLGIVGEYTTRVQRALKLPAQTAGFEIDTAILQHAYMNRPDKTGYTVPSRFPRIRQDMTIIVDDQTHVGELTDALRTELLSQIDQSDYLVSFELRDIYQKSHEKHVTYRLDIAHYKRTLTDQEINNLLDTIAAKSNTKRI